MSYIDSTVNAVNRAEEKKAAAEPELMETFCPHSMRHTFATRALERGIPLKVVQSYLGHSTIDMTMNIYTHVTAELEREEIKRWQTNFDKESSKKQQRVAGEGKGLLPDLCKLVSSVV